MTEAFHITIGNARLAGVQAGEGKAIIFLHAGVVDKRMWTQQVNALSNSYHAVAYDRRGFGETYTPNEAFSHVEDLRHILENFGIAKAVLVGCSQGGRVALDFALQYPRQVRALVLIAPAVSGAPTPESFPPFIQEKLEALEQAEEAKDSDLVNRIEANLWLDGPLSQEGRVSGEMRELFLDMNGIALRHPELSEEISPPATYDRVANLTMPTLLLWGELDFPHVKERCRYIATTMPLAQARELAGVAHLPSLEQPQQVNELLETFFSDL
jgi:pimeloyl-ACP methyl ester carboxylesterase